MVILYNKSENGWFFLEKKGILGWLVYSSEEFVRHQSMFLSRCSSDLFKK